MAALEETLHKLHTPEKQDITRQNAALRIQQAWRMRKKYLGPDFLWTDLAMHAQMKMDRDAAEQGRNTSQQRWRRGGFLAGRLQDGNDLLSQPNADDNPHSDAARKHLETQHWLELIDGYLENIVMGPIYYHQRWEQDDTTENFFRWLDHGGGKNLSLRECPREQFERERITYLSPEQRLNYLVTVDNEGKLRWVRNGQLVDTTAGHWKDAGDGKGIIPFGDPRSRMSSVPRHSFTAPTSRSSLSTSLSGGEETAMMHYVGLRRQSKNPVKRVLLKNFTLRGLLEKLLAKTVKRNTWIYVSDKNFNIFIGIKAPGSFQHSSFLAGGLVTSAGLISVKDGAIHTLSPLSGHYRTSIDHFRKFLSVLEERGVDMRKVEISKAELALWGIEHITKFKKKQAKAMETAKEETATATKRLLRPVTHPSGSGWKREILEGRKRRQSKEHEREVEAQVRRQSGGPEGQLDGQKRSVAHGENGS